MITLQCLHIQTNFVNIYKKILFLTFVCAIRGNGNRIIGTRNPKIYLNILTRLETGRFGLVPTIAIRRSRLERQQPVKYRFFAQLNENRLPEWNFHGVALRSNERKGRKEQKPNIVVFQSNPKLSLVHSGSIANWIAIILTTAYWKTNVLPVYYIHSVTQSQTFLYSKVTLYWEFGSFSYFEVNGNNIGYGIWENYCQCITTCDWDTRRNIVLCSSFYLVSY